MASATARRLSGAVAGWTPGVRVRDWAHFLALPLATADSLGSGARGALIAALVLSFGYLINGLADRELDSNVLKNPFVDGEAHYAAEACAAFAILALALALTGPPQVSVATIVCLASGFVYSVGPRLKRLPGVGTLLNVTNFLPLLWVGAASSELSPSTALLAGAFGSLLLQNQLIHEAADAADDQARGVRTTVLALGPRAAAVCAALLGGAATVSFALSRGMAVAAPIIALVFGLGFPAALAVAGHRRDRMGRTRLLHRWFSVAAGAALFLSVKW